LASCVVESNPLFGTKINYSLTVKTSAVGGLEVVGVFVKNQPHNSPHIVLAIGIEEIHRPALPLGWETAEHKHPRPRRQEWLQGVSLDGDIFY
jgi:hypothetical protein